MFSKSAKLRWMPRLLLVFVLIFTIFTRFWGLTEIRELIFDEVYFAKFGQDLLTFQECPQYSMAEGGYKEDRGCYDVHPPLGKLIIAAGENLFALSDFTDYEAQKKRYQDRQNVEKNVGDFHYEFAAENVLGWRIMPALFGVLLIFLMYVLGAVLFKSEWLGLLAAFLAAIDNYFLVQSRVALMDVFMLSFQLAAVLFFILGYRAEKAGKYACYILAAVMAGLALGVKFTGVAVMVIFAIMLIYSLIKNYYNNRKTHGYWKQSGLALAHEITLYVGVIPLLGILVNLPVLWDILNALKKVDFILLKSIFGGWLWEPIAGFYNAAIWTVLGLYILRLLVMLIMTFVKKENIEKSIFESVLHSITLLFGMLGIAAIVFWGVVNLPEVVMGHPFPWEYDIQNKFDYHINLKDGHPYASGWQLWPFSYKPVFYYYRLMPVYSEVISSTIWQVMAINAHGNLLLWWFGTFAVAYLLFNFFFKKIVEISAGKKIEGNNAELLILAGYFASWVPWILISRIAFLYHFLPSVPFMILAVVYALGRIWEWPILGKKLVIGLLVLFTASFLFYYPVSVGLPISESLYRLMMFT